jgi:uncharacterized protein (DUF983 family)
MGAANDRRLKRSWIMALLCQRCPNCRDGALFQSLTVAHRKCPVCGLVIEREPGYFMGALYVSYALGIVILIPLFFIFKAALPLWSNLAVASISLVPYLPLTLVVFRYSRVIWVYFDRSTMSVEEPEE